MLTQRGVTMIEVLVALLILTGYGLHRARLSRRAVASSDLSGAGVGGP